MNFDNKKSVVIHNGTTSTIAGFSTNELPKCVLPSCYIKKNNDSLVFGTFQMMDEAAKSESGDEVFTIMDSNFGVPYNWEALEQQWRYIYENELKCSPSELPLVITIPSILNKNVEVENKIIEQYCKLAFEKMNIPYLQIINESLAISLGMGKKSSLIIDISGSGCSVTPIMDGIIIKNGIMKSKFGGDVLDFEIKNNFEQKLSNENNDNAEQSSLTMWLDSQTWIRDFKRSMVQVSDKKLQDAEHYYEEQIRMQQELKSQYNSSVNTVGINPLSVKQAYLYKKANQTIDFELRECYKLGEILFQPNLVNETFNKEDGIGELIFRSINAASLANNLATNASNNINVSTSISGTTTTTTSGKATQFDSNTMRGNISSSNNTAQFTENISNLLNNIIIKGNSSLISGIETRIINEISIKFPQYKITTFANQILIDRFLQSWSSCITISKLGDIAVGMGNTWYCKSDYESKLDLNNQQNKTR